MSEVRYNNISGTLGGSGLTGLSSASVMTFAATPAFPSISSSDFAKIAIDPNLATYEIVYLSPYTSGSVAGTILRGQEGTSPQTHVVGATWIHGATAADFTSGGGSVSSVFGRTGAVTASVGDYTAQQVGAANVFNVKSATYGAVGNGVTDDTTAINAAITAAGVSGGTVFFPQGNYLISGSLNVASPYVTLRGINDWINWSGVGGSTIQVASSMASPLVNIQASNVAVEGLSFSTTSGTASVSTVSVPGSSGTHYNNIALKRIYSTNLGGVSATYMTRFLHEDVVIQSWQGNAGFSHSNCSIGFFNRCNAAPASVGTVSTQIYNYQSLNSGSLNWTSCESNGSPYYGFYAASVVDSEAYDLECNGATKDQMRLTGCGDWMIFRPYTNRSASVALHIDNNSSNIRVTGGWFDGATTSAVLVDGSVQSCYRIGLSNLLADQDPSSSSALISLTGNVFDVAITGCNLKPSGSNAAIDDESTNSSRYCTYAANNINPGGPNAITYSTVANLVIQGNAGFTGTSTSAGPLDLASYQIHHLANGSVSSDAATLGQIPTSASVIGGLAAANNLSDVASASVALGNLGVTGELWVTGMTAGGSDNKAVIDAVLANAVQGQTVMIPPPPAGQTWFTSGGHAIPNGVGVAMTPKGAGQFTGNPLIKMVSGSSQSAMFASANWYTSSSVPSYRVSVSNLSIHMNGQAIPAIVIAGQASTVNGNCVLSYGGSGSVAVGGIIASATTANGTGLSGASGIWENRIYDNKVYGGTSVAIPLHYGIWLKEGTGGVTVTDTWVERNIVGNTGADCIHADRGGDLFINDNEVYDNKSGTGIFLNNAFKDHITGNQVSLFGSVGAASVTYYGIQVQIATGPVVVKNNILWNKENQGAGAGIYNYIGCTSVSTSDTPNIMILGGNGIQRTAAGSVASSAYNFGNLGSSFTLAVVGMTDDSVQVGGPNPTPVFSGAGARYFAGYSPTAASIPATTVPYTNVFGITHDVYVTGGVVTEIAVNGVSTGQTSGLVRVPAGATITLTYSVAPTWVWIGGG